MYESGPGPTVVTTADGGKTWNDARLVEPGDGRHFWPEALTFAPDGALWFAVPSMSDADIAQGKQTDVTVHVFQSSDRGRTCDAGAAVAGGVREGRPGVGRGLDH